MPWLSEMTQSRLVADRRMRPVFLQDSNSPLSFPPPPPPQKKVHGLSLPTSPVLKYKQQRGVACLAWKPHSSGELAVGCLTGLLVWTVDPTSVAAR